MIMMMMMTCFCDRLIIEKHLVFFSAGTIVRDPHHPKSLTQARFESLQNLDSGLVELS